MTARLSVVLTAALVTSACTKEPEPFEVARIKAGEAFKKNEYAAAAADYAKSLELKPDQDLVVYDRAAFSYMKANEYDRAAEFLEKSLARRADAAAKGETLRNIATMYLQTAHDADKAEKWFQKALELDAKDEQALSWLAEISSQRGGARLQTAEAQPEHLKQALERYDAVIALTPNKPDPYINKRIVFIKYLEYLDRQRLSILADAEANKKDKEAYESAQEQAKDTQTRIDELKAQLDETTKKLGEINRAAKAAKEAAGK
ncbi:MAG: tetratricopeptide repeat protein [Myxococcota bacterium]